ncbi:hypothetical protein L6452_14273 [Arctium lappa]|uniref:Uncharacterized protein n=1 Tax=Arctium lappa TaxID=4217 RepID=A0ACB9CKL3_ARCLA|nr:hypothetical protein L6452_14273 [Arctium lappa]
MTRGSILYKAPLGLSSHRSDDHGRSQKKMPFQKHREEEEAKKKRAEDETTRLYAEFVESFQGDNAPGSKAFVRGGTINSGEKAKVDMEGGNSKDVVSGSKKGSSLAKLIIDIWGFNLDRRFRLREDQQVFIVDLLLIVIQLISMLLIQLLEVVSSMAFDRRIISTRRLGPILWNF